ncbi:HAMP domain-containing sensor histidine kinase [Brevibacillus sp. HB2.2]|uniref:sensor histidine kinase n=1 Tax=Brevibacillus sp. HB2.2 TaxID=2738846 RepID=UPI00156A82B5|nr:HAMP domain-containing sensor histidine kinase [Brevibacillus sp. HB2.2]NRS47158.1 HAMP domain-containing histidine kinase [Brevibacillus sp. HB2.2]
MKRLRLNVVTKLFAATFVFVFLLYALILIGEKFFFERFYLNAKVSELSQAMASFPDEYAKLPPDKHKLDKLVGTLMNRTDASIAIVDEQLRQLNLDPYFLEMKVANKNQVITLPLKEMKSTDLPEGLHVGDTITIDGIYMDEKNTIMKPIRIARQSPSTNVTENGLTRVTAVISELMLPSQQRAHNPFYQDSLVADQIGQWLTQQSDEITQMKSGSFIQRKWTDPWSGVNYAIVIHRFSYQGGANYILAVTTLQPVSDAVSMLTSYSLYATPVILVILLLLSFVFSKIITQPLVTLSHSASRMANLDFTELASIHSRDEFGELSRHLNTLAGKLDQTLKDLKSANVTLREDLEHKEKMEQLRKELIANISHELKTPLGIVKGFAEGLKDDVAHEKRERYMDVILSEVDKMNELIMDMLELSKFEAKAILLRRQSCSVSEIIDRVAASFQLQLANKQVRLWLALPEEFNVWADPRRIEQVIVNLLGNAVRHANPSSEIRITGVLERECIRFRIENEGAHIPDDQLTRIWEQFYRVDSSRWRKSGGTGLGLAICKHILDLHGSDYGAENTVNGVAFSFTLDENENKGGNDNEFEKE